MRIAFTRGPDGLIRSKTLEINAVHGCNLSCRACSHTSPIQSPRRIADPDSVHRDLLRLARWYRTGQVRILGGEPLLHPDLLALVAAIRSAGIAERIRLVTNGTLLSRAQPELWRAVDEVYVSVYPGHEQPEKVLSGWRRLARKHRVALRLQQFDHFRESYSEIGTQSDDLVRRIYESCLIAHVWRCHNVVDGVFYKCPQSYFLSASRGDPASDGVAITDDEELPQRLLAYLNSERPLRSCVQCLGAVGQLFPHEEVRRSRWREPQMRSTEELVDYGFLTTLERDPSASNSCITSEVVIRQKRSFLT